MAVRVAVQIINPWKIADASVDIIFLITNISLNE